MILKPKPPSARRKIRELTREIQRRECNADCIAHKLIGIVSLLEGEVAQLRRDRAVRGRELGHDDRHFHKD